MQCIYDIRDKLKELKNLINGSGRAHFVLEIAVPEVHRVREENSDVIYVMTLVLNSITVLLLTDWVDKLIIYLDCMHYFSYKPGLYTIYRGFRFYINPFKTLTVNCFYQCSFDFYTTLPVKYINPHENG